MQAGALVYCLLDAEGAYTPDGYEALDTAVAGDYELKLWRGIQHRDGQPVKFNELSLNVKGRNFDPESQAQKVPRRSTHALGRRDDLLRIVASWLKDYPTLYIGSYIQSKVRFYHRIFTHYMPMLDVSAPFAAFDECEGQPEYFTVSAKSGVIESILEGLDDVDPETEVRELGNYRANMKVMAQMLLKRGDGFSFDATPAMAKLEDTAICALVRLKWCCNPISRALAFLSATDSVADPELKIADAVELEDVEDVRVNEEDAYHWIKWNRPRLLPEIDRLLAANRAEDDYYAQLRAAQPDPDLQQEADDVDVQRYINELTPVMDQAISAACKQLDKAAEDSNLYPENFNNVAASIVDYVVIHFHLDGDDDEAIRNYNTILHHLLKYVERKYPDSDLDRSLAAADGRAARGHPAGDVQ